MKRKPGESQWQEVLNDSRSADFRISKLRLEKWSRSQPRFPVADAEDAAAALLQWRKLRRPALLTAQRAPLRRALDAEQEAAVGAALQRR